MLDRRALADRITVGSIVTLGIALRLPQTFYGLPAARHPDSAKTVDVALALSNAWRGGHFAIDPHTYQYPTLFINALAVLLLMFRKLFMAEQLGRLLAAVSSAVSALVVFQIGQRLSQPRVGLIAAVLASFGFLFVLQGRQPSPDSLQALLTACAVFFLLRDVQPRLRDIIFSGIAAGLAVGTKYTAIFYLLPILGVTLAKDSRSGGKMSQAVCWALAMVGGFIFATPSFLIEAPAFIQRARVEMIIQKAGDLSTATSGVFNFLFSTLTSGSHQPFPQSIGGTLGWPLTLAAIISILWTLAFRRIKNDSRFMSLSTGILFAFLYFSWGSNVGGVRFLLPGALLATLPVAEMVWRLSEFAANKLRASSNMSTIVSAALTLFLLWPNLTLCSRYLENLHEPDSRNAAAEWLLAHAKPGQRILNFIHGPALPPGRFDVVQLNLPEYRFELPQFDHFEDDLKSLQHTGINCVVWNDFYFHDLETSRHDLAVDNYWTSWRALRDELIATQKNGTFAHIAGRISPNIDIFCREDARWIQ